MKATEGKWFNPHNTLRQYARLVRGDVRTSESTDAAPLYARA